MSYIVRCGKKVVSTHRKKVQARKQLSKERRKRGDSSFCVIAGDRYSGSITVRRPRESAKRSRK